MKFRPSYIFTFLFAFALCFNAEAQTQTTYYVLNQSTEKSGRGDLETYELSGPGATLTFDAKRNTGASYPTLTISVSTDGSSFTQLAQTWSNGGNGGLGSLGSSYSGHTLSLDASVKKIRFNISGGLYTGQVKNVKVTRATTLSSDSGSLDFGTINRTIKPNGTVTRTISLDYNNTYSNAVLSVISCPDGFSVSDLSGIEETGSNKTITITYNPSSLGTHQGNITLSMGTSGKENDVTLPISVKGNCTIDYSVRFNGNGSTTGSMSDQNFQYGVAQELSANAFQRSYTLKFDTDGGDTIDNKTLTHTFGGWSKSPSGVVQYNDRQEVSNLTTKSGETVNLYAKWASAPYSLPTPAKDGFTFAGWYDGETNVGMGGETYCPSQDVTLKAKWVANGRAPQFNLKQGLNNPQDLYVGDHIDGAFTLTNISKELNIQISPAEGVINVSENEGVVSIEAIGAGTATIKFRQPSVGDILERESVDYVFHVNKRTPVFNWKIDENQNANTTLSDFFELLSGNEDLLSITSDNMSLASVHNGTLHIGNGEGTALVTVTHSGTVEWEEKTEKYTVKVNKSSPSSIHVPFTITQDNYTSFLTGNGAGSLAWNDGGLRLGDGGDGMNWSEKYRIIKFEGIPGQLSFSVARTNGSTQNDWSIKVSEDGNNWSNAIWSSSANEVDNVVVELSPATRFVRISYNGNFGGYYRNITVTELKQYAVDKESINFGRNKENTAAPQAQSITLTHSNAVNVTSVTCSDNDNFGIDKTLITSTGGDKFGEEVINISYKNINVGIHEATITISDGTNTRTVTVKGETYDATLTLDPENPDIVPDTYEAITLKRTLSAGLISIALPFDTTVEALTGNQSDKAYTLCNVGYKQGEGYTFYFKEVEGGALQAGKPYVISLSSEVVNPLWGETTIGELNPGTVTCGAWSFEANFEAGKSMNGLYGVVNNGNGTNAIMLGGAGSTLNAYSAYFRLTPAAAGASTAASTKASAAEDTPAGAIPLFTIPVK